ncbi:hypothetical protein B0I35DRAFT_484294 [Stachybotrys elegans]|uniref:Uncharacterized protein n=1 Tax=Stachybotrys elegans TaxID=80388 RepID=A0A8K0SF92_9HYPO|nr:hypothetical protein B0I35DRAFT_484294 [Stachybotrys elegans]
MWSTLSFIAAASLAKMASAQVGVCKEGGCGDCPVSTTTVGTGWPECVIYNSADVFTGLFDRNADTGKWDVWFDFPSNDQTCQWLLKSPAAVDIQTCGVPLVITRGPACRSVSLDESFMLQFCCGSGDCCAAGAPNVPGCNPNGMSTVRRDLPSDLLIRDTNGDKKLAIRATSGGVMFLDANGNIIPPAYQGPPVQPMPRSLEKPAVISSKRQESCTAGSWVDEGAEFQTTSSNSQVVSELVDGGPDGVIAVISKQRTSTWSTTMEANVGFADIFSMGISFSITQEESISTSETYEFPVPAGQRGFVSFTPYVVCKNGRGECGGGPVEGRVCIPYRSNGWPAGEYRVVQT